ncbi:hypothetical protein J6590_107634 [Homalodisca vitripennis]|nr:hypothetical protein J6590_107634 [Homalodisca vitripennis]
MQGRLITPEALTTLTVKRCQKTLVEQQALQLEQGCRRWRKNIKPQTNRNLSDERQLEIARTLFTNLGETNSAVEEVEAEENHIFTEEELKTAAGKIKAGKASGPDMTPPEIVKITAESYPQTVLDAMNDLLAKG